MLGASVSPSPVPTVVISTPVVSALDKSDSSNSAKASERSLWFATPSVVCGQDELA